MVTILSLSPVLGMLGPFISKPDMESLIFFTRSALSAGTMWIFWLTPSCELNCFIDSAATV